MTEHTQHHPDFSKLSEVGHSQLMSFLMWLLMVNLKVEADDAAAKALADYSTAPENSLIYSIAPHTGHPDSLFVYKAIEQLAPQSVPQLQFVSARDTWSSKMSKMIARVVAGEPYLFDRENLSVGSMRTQINDMAALITAEAPKDRRSLAMYPQGTRTIGAPIEHLPVSLAQQARVPLAVFNIYGAEQVMPKVAEGSQFKQVIDILIQRMHTWKSRHHVRVRLVDFIPTDMNRKAMKERFMTAHHQSG